MVGAEPWSATVAGHQSLVGIAVLLAQGLGGTSPTQRVGGGSQRRIIDQNELCYVLADLYPVTPGHALVIPKRHIESVNHLQTSDDQLVGAMIRLAAQIARERGVHDSGYRTVLNCNSNAGQTVFHIHLHLLGGRRLAGSATAGAARD